MDPARFLTLGGTGDAEHRVHGSLFLGHAAPARCEEEARAVINERQTVHFAATHNCFAWRFRGGAQRASDAGEPGGSAGAPILAAIDGAELVDCVVVVTRYFGGTKLGVGGLVRAYGESGACALAAAPRRLGIIAAQLRVRYAYAHTAAVMRALEHQETFEVVHGYAADGQLAELRCLVAATAVDALTRFLREATAGEVVPEHVAEVLTYVAAPG